MFGSTVLEVATGLVFVFLMVSLVCSSVGDKISDLLKWRAIELENGIRKYILSGMADVDLVKYTKVVGGTPVSGKSLKDLYSHPLIRSLAIKDTAWQQLAQIVLLLRHRVGDKPINIPSQTFVLALFDTFIPNASGATEVDQLRVEIQNALPEGMPLKRPLLALVTSADEKIDVARKRVEDWFNGAMYQTTMIYKRNMWRLALLIGISVSVICNVDSIAISYNLWRDPALRATLSAAAGRYTTGDLPQDQVFDKVIEQINNLVLPIGWHVRWTETWPWVGVTPNDWLTLPGVGIGTVILKILGWLITGLAGAQGAPFWFDVLNRLTNRNSKSAT